MSVNMRSQATYTHACLSLGYLKPRRVLYAILNLVEEAVVLMGPDCRSWGLPARGTSMRNYMNVLGAMHLPFVADGNLTISRTPACIM